MKHSYLIINLKRKYIQLIGLHGNETFVLFSYENISLEIPLLTKEWLVRWKEKQRKNTFYCFMLVGIGTSIRNKRLKSKVRRG